MIKIRTLYIVLPLTILMAVGCYLKGWTAGIALWALLALVCVGRILRELPAEALPFCCRFRRLSAAICALRGLHFAAKPL